MSRGFYQLLKHIQGGPYMTSRSDEAKTFLDAVKSQFKEGNLMLYEQAVKNLEQFYTIAEQKKERRIRDTDMS